MQMQGNGCRYLRVLKAERERDLQDERPTTYRNKHETFRVTPIMNANEKLIMEEYLQAQESVVIKDHSPDSS